MTVFLYGEDRRLEYCRGLLDGREYPGILRVVLLPIPTTRDGVHILGTDITFLEFCLDIRPQDLIVGYALPREIREAAAAVGGTVLDLSLDEKYITENAHLTAIGVAARLLENGESALSDMSIGIIGYGRIGEKLAHILMFFGARVKVFTSKSEVRRRLCMLGVNGVDYFSELNMADAFADLDILINTAPAKLITESSAIYLLEKRVIELASGDNMPACLRIERMASVPAVMFPKTAGKVVADAIERAAGIN